MKRNRSKAGRPKKPSGAAFRKIRRAKIAAALKASGLTPDFVRKPTIGALQTVAQWQEQVADIYRRARLGEMPDHVATKLTFIANVGAQLARTVEEIRELTALREQLEALKNGGVLLPHQSFNGAHYLPADTSTEGDQ